MQDLAAKGITLTREELISMGRVQIFLRDSQMLKKNRILGKFVDFDDRVPDNAVMVTMDHRSNYQYVQTDSVVAVLDGWVIGGQFKNLQISPS